MVKVPISSKFIFPHLILHFNFSIWIKSDFVIYDCLKPENPIFLRSTRAADHSIDMLRVVTQIQERATSGLSYLACFTFVVHAKCSSPACCMNYKVEFTEVKQVRKVKPEVTCSLIYVTTHSKRREDWCEWWTKMAANLNLLQLLKEIAFYPNQIFLSQKFTG